jgi:predicted MFS family arabinose efflux permease
VFRKIFKAFHYRDFRILWMGACTSSIGSWMQQLAQAWLVLEKSKSPFMLGLDAFLGNIPIFLFSLVGGVIADRIDRRYALLGSQYVQMACALLLTTLIIFDKVEVWHILCLSFVVGTAQSFGGPAYSALVPSLVSKEDLPNAIAMNSIQFNLARVIGPVIGGIILKTMGPAWCFGLNALSFVAVIISLYSLRITFNPPRTGESVLTSMKQGFGFIRNQGAMESLIVIAFLMTGFAIPMITFLPVFAKNVFQKGPETLSLFLACTGLGSISGALTVAAIGNVKNKGRIALTTLMLLGTVMALFAQSKSMIGSCILLFVAGACLICAFTMISSLVQLITANEMRGRVMSVYNVAFRGGMPFGDLLTGRMIPVFTAPVVIAANGVLLFCLGFYFLVIKRRVAEL